MPGKIWKKSREHQTVLKNTENIDSIKVKIKYDYWKKKESKKYMLVEKIK